MKNEFFEKERILLSSVYEEISNDLFIFSNINKISPDLILRDYITYYLDKYIGNSKGGLNDKLIELLLILRFDEKKEQIKIIKDNENDPIRIILIKLMWIESNVNNILNILNAFNKAKELFSDANIFYDMIEEIIHNEDTSIKYIINKTRNPEYTREVNECFYIILASLCLCITSDKIQLTESLLESNNNVEINQYCYILKEINNILQTLNKDLNISLNEMYIIDELIEIIELQKIKKNIDINKIETIRKYLRDNALIIQNDQPDKMSDLIINFQNIYDVLISKEIHKEEDENYKNKYYDTLRYIFSKEITKIIDANYRSKILEKLISEKEIIKKSNDIFQILLKQYIKTGKDDFPKNLENIQKGKDEIIKLIENNLTDSQEDNYFALSETLLYFFEKNSLMYLNNALYDEKKPVLLEKEPLELLEKCIEFLDKYLFSPNKLDKHGPKIKHITKLFCLGYIKTYCTTFINMFDDINPKFKEPEKIIESINKNDLKKRMIKLYIYKILYNQNQKQIDVFLNKDCKKKYKLEKYKDFKDFIKFTDEEQINYGFETLDNDNYENIYKTIEKYKKDDFKKKINKEEINAEELCIDNFYTASINLILSNLKKKEFEKSEIYNNFYKNICKPLFEEREEEKKEEEEEEKEKISTVIQFLFNPNKYEKIKETYKINEKNIDSLLYGYRYCLNELSNEKVDSIYSTLYEKENIGYLSDKCYPGSDAKDIPYYELYSKIRNHFKKNPNEGCYVCLCNKGFYQLVPSGFPGYKESNITCPNCKKNIGAIYTENEFNKKCEIVKRENYCRIFKDEEEIDELKNNKDKREKLEEIYYITLDEFKEKYIQKLFKNDKGLPIIDQNHFKKDNKIIRNLSQVSYRLLNYILYSHLFFARLFTTSKKFDSYLPKEMNWGETLNECWILLKNELSKIGINSIEMFMNFTFKDLFDKLHDKECIENYEDLIDFEDKLEECIQEKIEKTQEQCKKYKKLINKNNTDKNSSISLLKEKYENSNYLKEEYPYYENFYYTEYLDEKHISEILSHMHKNKYPILNKYLEYKKKNIENNSINDDYSLDKLNLFNTVLNLFNEKYSHLISRDYAEKKLLEDEEIYQNEGNRKLIDKFIRFYNNLKRIDSKGNIIKLNNKNPLSYFVLDDNNEIGKTYKDIYKIYIEKQNKEIEELLEIKIIAGIFNSNCTNRINIQQIKEDEIFTFNVPEKFSFVNEIFNSSYRKIIDNNNYEIYNQYEINLDYIEENMTNILLKNKKLLNDYIIEFRYNNELFSNEVKDLITLFKKNYLTNIISLDDKVIIYNFIIDNEKNKDLYKKIINDFITLLQYLNKLKKEKDNNITGNSIIFEVIEKLKDNLSKEFFTIFEDKNDLTINKTSEIFEFYLKLIFKYIKDDINEYQEPIEKNLETSIKLQLDNYYQKEDEHIIISKYNLASAIRLFITLVLFTEDDKENKIKNNRKNLVNYLNVPDLWENQIYNDPKFNDNISYLKTINIQINQILWLYYYLIEDKEDNYSKEVEEYIESQDKKKNEDSPVDVDPTKNVDNKNDSESESSSESENNNDDDEPD